MHSTASLLLLSLAASLSRCLLASAQATSSEFTSEDTFRSAVLNSTNTYRHQHDVSLLRWNDSLADYATEWTDDCVFAHSGGPTGENLATGYSSVTSAIDGWGSERKDYSFSKGDFSSATGHFTQLVWQDTTSVGCAVKDCGSQEDRRGLHSARQRERRALSERETRAWGWYLVCEYYPPGNVLGHFTENVREQSNADGSPSATGTGSVPVETTSGGEVKTQAQGKGWWLGAVAAVVYGTVQEM